MSLEDLENAFSGDSDGEGNSLTPTQPSIVTLFQDFQSGRLFSDEPVRRQTGPFEPSTGPFEATSEILTLGPYQIIPTSFRPFLWSSNLLERIVWGLKPV